MAHGSWLPPSLHYAAMAEPVRMIAWAQANQESLVRDMVRRGGFELVGIVAAKSGDTADLGIALAVERIEKLRDAILHDDIQLLWLAASGSIQADERHLIRQQTTPTISNEPWPGSIAQLQADPSEADTARFVPMMRHSPGYRAAQEVFEQFGPRQCVNVSFRSGPGEGSLFARLFDAIDLLEVLCGDVEMMDAALAGPLSAPPDSLSGLHGHLTLNMRYSGNCCSCVALSDCAGSWFRGVTVLGQAGCLRIDDQGFEWVAPDGEIIDSDRQKKRATPGELIAVHTIRLLENLQTTEPPPVHAKLLAVCEATRLSCRTGQGEAPRKMLEMLSRP